MMEDILLLIQNGHISLLSSPPRFSERISTRSEHDIPLYEDRDGWWLEHEQLPHLAPREILARCIGEVDRRFSGLSQETLLSKIETEVGKNMLDLQTEPAIAEPYRRFVVIQACRENIPEFRHEVSFFLGIFHNN
jgi:hypothetical protein